MTRTPSRSFFSSSIRTFARSCVPVHSPLNEGDLQKFVSFLTNSPKLLVLTGAGISTESGLPDYRSEGIGAYARNKNFVPVQYQTFVKSSDFRQKYWLKNYLGWNNLHQLEPNIGHLTLASLERDGRMIHLITQNVDNLHYKAGSRKVIELHGTSHRVMCLGCTFQVPRLEFQDTLSKLNPLVNVERFELNPDGDVDIGEEDFKAFVVPPCSNCGGFLKPDIVFFGDNVPKDRVQAVNDLVDECDSLVICGSSLSVQSSYRIASRAKKMGKPIAAVNIGKTRADDIIHLKVEAKCGDALPAAYHSLLQNEGVVENK